MRAVFAVLVLSFLVTFGAPAHAQQIFTSREDFHEGTAYGTLAFNKSARTQSENRYQYKNFSVVPDGQVDLPDQSGFCFLLNHYNSPHPAVAYQYTFTITEWFSVGTSSAPALYTNSYTPTTRSSSWEYPDYCLRKLYNLARVDVQTSSTEGPEFRHHFFFKVSP
jgi:hypothetical protein